MCKMASAAVDWQKLVKLLIGAGGIYATFLYYGTLQEDVYSSVSPSGEKFKYVWFLQMIETLANVIVAGSARVLVGGALNLPLKLFALSGGSQLCAKAFSSFALTQGVSFPIVTLAKSGKMVPVMIGSLLVGKASYTTSEYLSVLGIVIGTCLVSFGGKARKPGESSMIGLLFIVLSLSCDGITGGLQSRLKKDLRKHNPQPYDFMLFTNLFMMIYAVIASVVVAQDFQPGVAYCIANPAIFHKFLKFAVCSAIGQSFIFFTISNFDPLVCCTVTTTRKIISVFLSILIHGHELSQTGWAGIALASCGILMELHKETVKPKKEKTSNPQEQVEEPQHVKSTPDGAVEKRNALADAVNTCPATPRKVASPATAKRASKKNSRASTPTPVNSATPKKSRSGTPTPSSANGKQQPSRRVSTPSRQSEDEGSPTPVKRRNNNKVDQSIGITTRRSGRVPKKTKFD